MARTESSRNFTERAIFIFCDLCPTTPEFRAFSKNTTLPSVTFRISRHEAQAVTRREAEQTHSNAEHKPDAPL